jgi:hypothetical protein
MTLLLMTSVFLSFSFAATQTYGQAIMAGAAVVQYNESVLLTL